MAALVTTDNNRLYTQLPSATAVSLAVQDFASETTLRPTFLRYGNRVYILGKFNPNVLVAENLKAYPIGISPPPSAPTITPTTGTVTGACIGRVTFVHRLEGGTLVHESDPSPASATVNLANQGRIWTALPTTSPDARVTHIRGYVSMDGTNYRLAWERELGTTSVTETVETLALTSEISFLRGRPPYALYGEVFHDRMWYIDGNDPTKVWFSELYEMESVPVVNFFPTKDGDQVTGIKKAGDTLVIFCMNSTYTVTGWDVGDFNFQKISPSVGCISHWSIVEIHGRLWFASQDGVYMYDGSFINLMKDMLSYWRENYLANTAAYENSIAADDKFWHTYKLLIPLGGPVRYYVGHYSVVEPELEGTFGQPDWVFDIRNRNDYTIGIVRSPNSRRDEFYVGSCDGFIRKENVEADDDDDGDTYGKQLTLRFKHFFFDDPGGTIYDGKNFFRLWSYVEAENNAWTLQTYGGDEYAGDGTVSWTDSVEGSVIVGHSAKHVHVHYPANTSGRGLTVTILGTTPLIMKVRGFGGQYKPTGTTGRAGVQLDGTQMIVYTNEGATALQTINLPSALKYSSYTFCVQDADGIKVVAAAGDTIRIATVVSAAGGYIQSTTIGSIITLVAINATEWFATAREGSWSVDSVA